MGPRCISTGYIPSKSFRKISVEGGTSSEVAPLDFLTARVAQVDPQGRAVVYTTVEGGQVEGHDGSRPGVREGAHAGSLDRPSSLVTGFPDRLRRLHGPGSWRRHLEPLECCGLPGRWGGLSHSRERLPCRSVPRRVPPVFRSRYRCRSEHCAKCGCHPSTAATRGRSEPSAPCRQMWGYDVSPTNQIVFTRLNASRRELWLANLK